MRYREFVTLQETGPATTSIGQDLSLSGSAALSGVGRYSAEEDKVEQKHLGDTRKPKITLKMLNRLKMIRTAKKLEMTQKMKSLGIMYGSSGEEEEPSI